MTSESDTPLIVWLAEQAETLRKANEAASTVAFRRNCSLADLIDGMLAEHAKGRRALAATIPGSDQITEAYALAVTIRCLKMLARHVADITGSVTP